MPSMTPFKKFCICLVCLLLILSVGFIYMEPATLGAAAASSNAVITLNVTTGITISSPGDSSMSTALGVSSQSAVGTTTWTVATNNVAGYTIALNATATPAMDSGTNTILDYQTGNPNTWNATTSNAYFGYSAFGTDVATSTWGNTTMCSGATANATSTVLKYKGFTTSPYTVGQRSSTTTSSGVDTTICYAVEQKNYYIPSGTYKATITATATTL